MSVAQKQKVFSSAVARGKRWDQALASAIAEAKAGLRGSPCDLAAVFVSEPYPDLDPAALSRELRAGLGCAAAIGCNASGVIGSSCEIEFEPAVSLMAMHLPGVKLAPFSISPAQLESMKDGSEVVAELDLYPPENPFFLCLADPMTCDIEKLAGLFNQGYPGAPLIGGLASGAAAGLKSWLVLGEEPFAAGAVGLALSGDVSVETVVSQGCRPIGRPMMITKGEGNIVRELAGKPALEALQETVASLSEEDRALARHSLFAGLAMDEYRSGFKRGDFVIRNLMGYDAQSGALMIGAAIRPGQTLVFQLRDAATSDEDLRASLGSGEKGGGTGALLFSCCGRGRGLYGKPDHDIGVIQSLRGPLTVAGFFANGELGPVSKRNYIHGYTSSLAILR